VHRQRGAHNRLGFALQLCALRYLGFAPDDFMTAPLSAVSYVAEQLGETPATLGAYGTRAHTRTDHLQDIMDHLGFHKVTTADWRRLSHWLVERALEHDKPSLLLQLACDRLRRDKIVHPGITRLERLVLQVRQEAQSMTYRLVRPLLTEGHKEWLDSLLLTDDALHRPPLTWLRQAVTANSPQAIVATLEKVAYLQHGSFTEAALLNPNRLKFLAQVGRRATALALQRMPEERRYPILLAFVAQALPELTDEAMDLFDRCLAETEARASRDLAEFRVAVAQATNEKVRLFGTLGRVILDPTVRDAQLRAAIYQRIARTTLQRAGSGANTTGTNCDAQYIELTRFRQPQYIV
jgi:hypothetical protein